MAEFHDIAIFQPIQVQFVSNLKQSSGWDFDQPSFQPKLKLQSKMAESKIEFHEIAIFQPIHVRFFSNLKLMFSFQPILRSKPKMTKSKMAESKMAEFKMAESKMAESKMAESMMAGS